MTIVVGYEGRLEGRDAVALGALLARAMDEPLLVACVHPHPETAFGHTEAELRAAAERTAAEGAAAAPPERGGDTRRGSGALRRPGPARVRGGSSGRPPWSWDRATAARSGA